MDSGEPTANAGRGAASFHPRTPARVKALANAIVATRGELPTRTRETIVQRARVDTAPDANPVEATLERYVDKVARHAYRVTDEDFDTLAAAGYSQDQILEATLCAAFGASLSRLERGLAALHGDLRGPKSQGDS